MLFFRGCDIDGMDQFQRTPLTLAVFNNIIAVRILLENNANMKLKDRGGEQPIHLAAGNGNYEYGYLHL